MKWIREEADFQVVLLLVLDCFDRENEEEKEDEDNLRSPAHFGGYGAWIRVDKSAVKPHLETKEIRGFSVQVECLLKAIIYNRLGTCKQCHSGEQSAFGHSHALPT